MEGYRKQGYLLENFRLFHLRSPQGAKTDFHYHEFCKLLLLVSGSGGYAIDGQRFLLQSGDIVLLQDGCIHRPELDPGIPYERMILYISPEFLASHCREDGDLYGLFSGERGPVLRLPEAQRQKLFRLARGLERDLAEPGFGRELLAQTDLLRLLVEIGRCREDGQETRAQAPGNQRIRDILAYIDAHLTEDLDADAIAGEFFISKYHMMRLFRQETGSSIHQYITQKRLMLAREMIRGGMKATEACYRCGWRSYSSFTRASEKHLGSTPTARLSLLPEDGEE